MKRIAAVLTVVLLVTSVVGPAVAVSASQGSTQQVGSSTVEAQSNPSAGGVPPDWEVQGAKQVSTTTSEGDGWFNVDVTAPEGQGPATLVFNRTWLEQKVNKPLAFMRFKRNGQLVDQYTVTKKKVIVRIPHFSTQSMNVTTVDGQFVVNGSATGQETDHVINYDVNETGIAILEIQGRGDELGSRVVNQFYTETDGSTFTWSTGDIPRNVSLVVGGQGSKYGPLYNESQLAVSDDERVTFDLVAKDYRTNVTIAGNGQAEGSLVEKGVFTGQRNGDSQTISFTYLQNNESIVFIGNTTTVTEGHSQAWQTASDWDDATTDDIESAPERDDASIRLGQPNSTWAGSNDAFYRHHSGSGSTLVDVTGNNFDGSVNANWTTAPSPRFAGALAYDGSDDYVGLNENIYGSSTANFYAAEFWVHPNSTGRQSILRIQEEFTVEYDDLTNQGFSVRIYGDNTGSIGPTGLSTNKWHHVNMYWDVGNEVGISVNGGPWYTYSTTDGADGITTYRLAAGANGEYPLDGKLTGVRFKTGSKIPKSDDLYIEKGNATVLQKQLADPVDPSSVQVRNVSATLNSQTVNVTVESDPDGDGTFEETGDTVTLNGSGGPYDVTGLSSESSRFRAIINITTSDARQGVQVSRLDVYGENSSDTKTTDPAIDIDGDGTMEASYTGTLNDSESVTVDVTENVSDGTHTFTASLTEGAVDWKYQGNNEGRAHVKNFTINGVDYTVDQFLAEGETVTIDTAKSDTVQGTNEITLRLYEDAETQSVDRIDPRGQYENRTVVDNVTVNGQEYNLDAVLADGENSTAVDITNAQYGDNDVTVQLKENTTQNNFDAYLKWNRENRTMFTNVTVEGVTFEGPDEYSGTTYNTTFLSSGETLTFNVTDQIAPGDNNHTFRMLTPRTETDTLDFTEKVEFYKNISVTISEKWATYNKTSSEEFNHTISSGTTFNFSVPSRVLQHHQTYVSTGSGRVLANSTTFSDGTVQVTLDEKVEASESDPTTVEVRVITYKYTVEGADTRLRDEQPLNQPYYVDVGLETVTGTTVVFEDHQEAFDKDFFEVIATMNGEPYRDLTANATFSSNTIGMNDDEFNDTVAGFIVRRPKYSSATYTGTTNHIHPDAVVEPDKDVVHDPALYTEEDVVYDRVTDYTVTDHDAIVNVTWRETSNYQMEWRANSDDANYTHVVQNVTTDNVNVLHDGRVYDGYSRDGSTVKIQSTSDGGTWTVYKFDNLTITSSMNISASAGETKQVEVQVHNPNNFTVHDVSIVTGHSWVTNIEPRYHDIEAGETVNYTVTVEVPEGTEPTGYTLPVSLRGAETGTVDATDMYVSVSGAPITGGTGISNFVIIVAIIGLFSLLVGAQAYRSGALAQLRKEVDEI